MTLGRVHYGVWLLRILAWDTVLPACVVLLPTAIEFLFPNRRGFIEFTAVLLPIVAFFVRLSVGKRHIAANYCSKRVQRIQFGVFCCGVLPLVLLECFIILSRPMRQEALAANGADAVLCIFLSIYLTSMVIALYPGRAPLSSSDPLAVLYGNRADYV